MGAICERIGLPFPRGTTYSQCAKDGTNEQISLTDANDNLAKNLEGRVFVVKDTIHNTGDYVRLRIVKNDSGADMAVARLLFAFSNTTKDDWGHRIDATASANGTTLGKPMDDAYWYGTEDTSTHNVWTTIPDNDLFYLVEEGPCMVLCEATGLFSVGMAAAGADRDGHAAPAAADDDSFGTALTVNSTSAVTANLFYIKAGIQGETP